MALSRTTLILVHTSAVGWERRSHKRFCLAQSIQMNSEHTTNTLGGPKGESSEALKYLMKPCKTKSYFERIWVEGRASSEYQAEYEGGLYGHMRSEALGIKSVQNVPQDTSLHSQ